MKQINGKDYYVSLGFVKEDNFNGGVKAGDIKSIFMKNPKDNEVMYLDDEDKDNVVLLPLIKVNEIQLKKDIYKFRVLADPFKMKFDEGVPINKLNIVGLFRVHKEGNTQVIKNIKFFKLDPTRFFSSGDKPLTLSVEANKNIILGE